MAWKRICGADEVAENTVKKFDVDGITVLLVNYGAGYRAIPPICPHMEEPLAESGVVVRCVLTCTKHLWAWDLKTLEMKGETEAAQDLRGQAGKWRDPREYRGGIDLRIRGRRVGRRRFLQVSS